MSDRRASTDARPAPRGLFGPCPCPSDLMGDWTEAFSPGSGSLLGSGSTGGPWLFNQVHREPESSCPRGQTPAKDSGDIRGAGIRDTPSGPTLKMPRSGPSTEVVPPPELSTAPCPAPLPGADHPAISSRTPTTTTSPTPASLFEGRCKHPGPGESGLADQLLPPSAK